MSININVGNIKKKVKDVFINKDGVKKKVKSIWVNKNNVASKVYSENTNPIVSGIFVFTKRYNGKTSSSFDGGLTWIPMTGIPTTDAINNITYGNGRFVCVGDVGASYYSLDGLTWIPMTGIPTTIGKLGSHMNSVTYGNGRFVCTGHYGKSYYSINGTSWSPMFGLLNQSSSYGVVYGNNKFVCIFKDYSYVYVSTDGITWYRNSSGLDGSCLDIVYGNGRFVCIGDNDKRSYASVDGLIWKNIGSVGWSTSRLGYGNEKFIACTPNVGENSYYSKNGEVFSPIKIALNCVTYGSGRFIGGVDEKVYSSIDGLTWNLISTDGDGSSIDIAYSSDGS